MLTHMITYRLALTGTDQTIVPPVKKVPDEILRPLCEKGLSPSEIVVILWEQYGIRRSRAAISNWRRKNGFDRMRNTSESTLALIPWRVKTVHANHRMHRALQAEAQYREFLKGRAKEPSRPNMGTRARVVEEYLEDGNTVIHYDPDSEQGFHPVNRRVGIDKDWIREPRIMDDGTRIIGPIPGLKSGA